MASKLFQNNILEIGLLRGLSASRRRLNTSVIGLTALAFGAGQGAMVYIEQASSSVVWNMALITLCMVLVLLAAYIQAIWIGDRIWPAAWRLQAVQGQEPAPGELPEKTRHMEFLMICAALVVANGLALDQSRGGFMERYHNEGFFEVRLRADDPAERVAALKAMSDPLQVKLWTRPGLRALVRRTLTAEQDAEVLAWAAWNAGAMKIEEARPELLALVEADKTPAPAREAAAQALGRLGPDEQAGRALGTMFERGGAQQAAALRALALMGRVDGHVERLKALSAGTDAELVRLALWALREAKPDGLRVWLRAELESPALKPGERRCALLDAMKMVATEQDVDWARLQYVREAPEERCEVVYWEERDERRHTLIYGDTTRVKLLKAVANAGGVTKHAEWFRRIAQDSGEPQHARELASLILQQADRWKSAER